MAKRKDIRFKDINFVEIYKVKDKRVKESNTPGKIYIALFFFTVLLMGGVTLRLVLDQKTLDNQIAELQEYVTNPGRVMKLADIEKMQKDMANLDDMEAELTDLNTIMDMIPRFDRKVMNVLILNAPQDLEIMTINYDGEWVELNVISDYLPSMSNYALNLERSGMFEEVYYQGYTASANHYEGTINIALKGNEVSIDE